MIPSWANILQGELNSAGFTGSDLGQLCHAIGAGCEAVVNTAQFITADTGSITGAGSGTGTGLTINHTLLADAIHGQLLVEFGERFNFTQNNMDDKLPVFCDKIALTCKNILDQVVLHSDHPVVFTGTGVIQSVNITVASWAGEIMKNSSFTGTYWPNIAQVIGDKCTTTLQGAVGQVAIAGTGTPTSTGAGVNSSSTISLPEIYVPPGG